MSSPSSWTHRAWLVALGLLGLAIALVLGLYQVGAIASVPDPFFGAGSERILTSSLARAIPLPDALLGAGAYTLDTVGAAVGDEQRWHEHPWLVLAYGVVVAGLFCTAVGLVLAQAFVFHAGCTLCLGSAAVSLTTGWLAKGEVAASLGVVRGSPVPSGSLFRLTMPIGDVEATEPASCGPRRDG